MQHPARMIGPRPAFEPAKKPELRAPFLTISVRSRKQSVPRSNLSRLRQEICLASFLLPHIPREKGRISAPFAKAPSSDRASRFMDSPTASIVGYHSSSTIHQPLCDNCKGSDPLRAVDQHALDIGGRRRTRHQHGVRRLSELRTVVGLMQVVDHFGRIQQDH